MLPNLSRLATKPSRYATRRCGLTGPALSRRLAAEARCKVETDAVAARVVVRDLGKAAVRVGGRDVHRDADKVTVEAAMATATVAETGKRAHGGPPRLGPTAHPLRDRATIGARVNINGTPVKAVEGATATGGEPEGEPGGEPGGEPDAVPGEGKAGVQGVMPDGNADYEAG